jgi:hypothetical protein
MGSKSVWTIWRSISGVLEEFLTLLLPSLQEVVISADNEFPNSLTDSSYVGRDMA